MFVPRSIIKSIETLTFFVQKMKKLNPSAEVVILLLKNNDKGEKGKGGKEKSKEEKKEEVTGNKEGEVTCYPVILMLNYPHLSFIGVI